MPTLVRRQLHQRTETELAWEPLAVAARATASPPLADLPVHEPDVAPVISPRLSWVLCSAVLVLSALIAVYAARHVSLGANAHDGAATAASADPELPVELASAPVQALLAGVPDAVDVQRQANVTDRPVARASARANESRREDKTKTPDRTDKTANSKTDKKANSKTQDAAAGKKKRADKPGFLTIDSVPYATIYIDGRAVGETPLVRLSLPAGSHDVRAVTADGSAKSLRVQVASGQTIRQRLRF